MVVDRDTRVRSREFRGDAQVHNGPLARHLRNSLRFAARSIMVDLGQGALTDSSGGSAGADIADIVVPPVFDSSSAGGATPASVNTAVGTYMDAYATLAERCNVVRAELQGDSVPEGPGVLGSGTIAVLDDTVAAASGDASASEQSVRFAIADVLISQRTIVEGINELRDAVGLGPIPVEGPQGSTNDGRDLPSPAIAALVAAGTSATTGVALAAIDTALGILADNVALLADMIDQVTGVALRQGGGGALALGSVAS
jgi:hypothetical protein